MPPKPVKVVPKEVVEQTEREKELKRSQVALQAAEDYHSEIDQKEADKKEKVEIAKLTREDLQLAQTGQASGGGQISLAQVEQKSKQRLLSESEAEEQLGAGAYVEEGTETESAALGSPAFAGAAATPSDLSGMSADDMRSYSESVAQAADVVNNESEAESKKEAEGIAAAALKKT